jgi:hypothetical protein
MSRTYQTRIDVSAEVEHLLDQYAELYNTAERHLFAETLAQGFAPESVKSAYQISYGIAARQFNAICRNLKGKVKSVTELRQLHLEEGKTRIAKAEKVIKSLRKKLASHQRQLATLGKRKKSSEDTLRQQKDPCAAINKLKHKLHHKTHRLVSLLDRRQRRQQDADAGKLRICFGSRKRFNTQFHLAANGYANNAHWQARRNNQFDVLGSREKAHPAYARMLSAFAYAAVQQLIQARASDAGIEVRFVDPAFTSVIGRHKFAARYGLSGHQSAACVIARQADRFSERPNRRDPNAQFLPARNRNRHVWSLGESPSQRSGAHSASPVDHSSRSSLPPAGRDEGTKRSCTGAYPVREPGTLFAWRG